MTYTLSQYNFSFSIFSPFEKLCKSKHNPRNAGCIK